MATRSSFGTYLKEAFKNRWNLLLFGAATAASLISGRADVALPLVAAGEITFLVSLATHPRFQHLVDSLAGARRTARGARELAARYDQLYAALEPGAKHAFDQLRARCEALGEASVADPAGVAGPGIAADEVAEAQLEGVNRLLWVYLKLTYTRTTLERFFATTDVREVERLEKETRQRLAALPAAGDNPIVEKKRRSMEDTLATATARWNNLKRAKENYELVGLELERIAAKLKGIVELAATRHDPSVLTHEVDDVSKSVESTEQMMGELQELTGLSAEDAEAPRILRNARLRVAQRARAG